MLSHWVDRLINQEPDGQSTILINWNKTVGCWLGLRAIKTLYFYKNFARTYDEIILGKSDSWSMRRSSNQPSDPVYYVEVCRILIPQIIMANWEFRPYLQRSFLWPGFPQLPALWALLLAMKTFLCQKNCSITLSVFGFSSYTSPQLNDSFSELALLFFENII